MAEAPKIPTFMRERLRAQEAGLRSAAEHPDADLLAAFGENTLARGERSVVINHLAACEACREVVMLSQAADETAKPVRLPAAPLLGWMTLRWASLAVVFVLTIGVVLTNRGLWQQPSRPASSQIPETPAAPGLALSRPNADEQKQFESDKPALSAKSKPASQAKAPGKLLQDKIESYSVPAGYAAMQENRIGRSSAGERQETKSAGLARRGAPAKSEHSYRMNSARANMPVVQSATAEPPAAVAPSVGTVSGAGIGAGTVQQSASATPQVAKRPTPGAELSASGAPGGTTAITAARQENFYDALAEQEPSKKKTAPEETPAPAAAQPRARQPVLARDDKNAVAQSLNAASSNFETKDEGEGLTISKEKLATASPTPMKWRIRAGKLQQSTDDGKTWQEVNLEPGVNLHSFWVQGASVWAGGTGGSLFHVSEQGKNAMRIPIQISGGGDVSQTVVTVTFSDELHGIITLENGQILRTADGGKTWERP